MCVRKGRNGRESLRRLKPTVGCNVSKRRRIYRTVEGTRGVYKPEGSGFDSS
jgi:hypothetical protein